MFNTERLQAGFVGDYPTVMVNDTWYPAIKTMNLEQAIALRDELNEVIAKLEQGNAS